MSQIAGRAGRYKNDGGFGTTGDCETLNSDEIEKIAKHELPDTKSIYWRNSNLDFSNPEKLIASLELRPNNKNLLRTNDSLDESVLRFFLKKSANNIIYRKNLELLWECSQIPDFEKKAYGQHLNIINKVFQFLSTRKRRIPSSFMKEQLKGLEKDHGNIDLLSHRLSNVRTWSYVANKKNWVENSDYWVQLTKSIEDKLSDKLHNELTKSFIDKKISILSRNLKQDLIHNTAINEDNKIYIDEQLIGELKGLKFLIEVTSKTLDTDIKSIKKAARKGVEKELIKRIESILNDAELTISKENKIIWKKYPIARLKKGNNYLSPEIEIIADDSLNEIYKLKLSNFLTKWLDSYVYEVLGDLIKLTRRKVNNQYLRGLMFQLYENNGVLKRDEVDKIVKLIPAEERKKLWGMGIKIGRYHIYLPKMLKPRAVEFRISLWNLFHSFSVKNKIPQSGLNFLLDVKLDRNFLLLCGFEKFKEFFVRIDILEKLFIKIIESTKERKFKINSSMMNLLGCSKENFFKLMNYMNYKKDKEEDIYIFRGERQKKRKLLQFDNKENPFNKLRSLNLK
jgi:ATP-dependent RNA helicase SUPV3L1/SUV3